MFSKTELIPGLADVVNIWTELIPGLFICFIVLCLAVDEHRCSSVGSVK